MRKALPPFEFDDAAKAEIVRQVAHTPGHEANFWMRQAAQARLMKMIEVRVSEQHQIDRREVLDTHSGSFDPLQEKNPIGEIGVDQHVQIVELDEKRGVADPSNGHLTVTQFRERRLFMFPGAPGQQRLPNHFVEESAGIEMLRRRQVFERAGERLLTDFRPVRRRFRHSPRLFIPLREENFKWMT